MDSILLAAVFTDTIQISVFLIGAFLHDFRRIISLIRLYGLAGIILFWFGSRATWQVQAQVLGLVDDRQANDFRKSVQDECTMISTAAAITAQIAITALSLSSLSGTHWLVRGFTVFSLTSALMAVYYATIQHKMMGRLLTAKQVRTWIRGGTSQSFTSALLSRNQMIVQLLGLARSQANSMLWPTTSACHFCDPQDLHYTDFDIQHLKNLHLDIMRKCFIPGIASVITMSAPQMLLSASLTALLIALGIYLGFVWSRNLDTDAGLHDSRNVFIMYLIGLGLCILIYSISQLIKSTDSRIEEEIVISYLTDYIVDHPDWQRKFSVNVNYDKNGTLFLTPAPLPAQAQSQVSTSSEPAE